MVSDRSKRRAFGMRGRVSVATRVISLKRIYFEGAWPLSDTRQEYKRARDEGERGGGARRRCLLVRRKEESGASTCIFHSFAILSIEEYVEERRERGRERGSGPSSSTTPFSSSIATERMLASFLSSRFQKELTTWKLKPLPLPALTFVRHFSSGTLARQSYSPFRHYVHPASVPFLQSGRVI